jgi:hypothetical protein
MSWLQEVVILHKFQTTLLCLTVINKHYILTTQKVMDSTKKSDKSQSRTTLFIMLEFLDNFYQGRGKGKSDLAEI